MSQKAVHSEISAHVLPAPCVRGHGGASSGTAVLQGEWTAQSASPQRTRVGVTLRSQKSENHSVCSRMVWTPTLEIFIFFPLAHRKPQRIVTVIPRSSCVKWPVRQSMHFWGELVRVSETPKAF